jgi:hypothetical protein
MCLYFRNHVVTDADLAHVKQGVRGGTNSAAIVSTELTQKFRDWQKEIVTE